MKEIHVFGIGAAGSNIVLNLIYSFPDYNITLIDYDKVENRNISAGTQPYTKMDINRPKVQALQRIIQVCKNKRVSIINKRIEGEDQIKDIADKSSLILDCFDNAKSRNLFLGLKDYNVLHVGFSGLLTGEAVWNEIFEPMKESKSDKEINVCEMSVARPFIMALTSISSLVISEFLNNANKKNVYFDKNLKINLF